MYLIMVDVKNKNLLPRSPIVVVLGHVDHGKTSLLDYIRKTNVIAKEAGGITQSIGAYEIVHNEKRITFIDTPGHEVFSKMRERGARAADLGILVVAADEGVKPQTKEAIEILNNSQTPFVAAINKIDKPNADIERVKTELMQAGVLLEGFGGNISWHGISAKTGEGVNELLDLILLAAELEGLTYNPEARAMGVIIESKIDSRRGITASVIVKDGILRIGDEIATPSAFGKVKILENFLGEKVDEFSPSAPALILGFETLPQVGEEFASGKIELAEIKKAREEAVAKPEEGLLNLILKADVSGSLEALSEVIKTFPKARVIVKSVGDITDGDVKSAFTSKAVIIGFRSRVSRPAENLAKSSGVKIIASEIIYELLKSLEAELKALEAPIINGKLEILGVFGKKNGRQIIGGRVLAGFLKNNINVSVQRGEQIIDKGKIVNLQKEKRDASQVNEGEECGMLFESDTIIKSGDILIY
jgi:translation initiation factor IF-2